MLQFLQFLRRGWPECAGVIDLRRNYLRHAHGPMVHHTEARCKVSFAGFRRQLGALVFDVEIGVECDSMTLHLGVIEFDAAADMTRLLEKSSRDRLPSPFLISGRPTNRAGAR
jgi:hypothetical protein